MNARHATPLVLTALTLALAACGNKGPLVLPTQPAPQEAPPAKPGEVPVTISTTNDPPVAAPPNARSTLPTPPLDSVLTPPATPKDGQDGKAQDGDGADPPKPADPASGKPAPVEPTPAGG